MRTLSSLEELVLSRGGDRRGCRNISDVIAGCCITDHLSVDA